MGRAIVRDPQAFLMDEPLSNLDAKLRVQTRTQVSRLQKRLGTTMVYVTHDQTEAMTLGDRLAVMRSGLLQQAGTPQELYDRPLNLFVAGFIGSPAMNFMGATLEEGTLRTSLGDLPVSPQLRQVLESANVGRQVIVGLRPEDFEDAAIVPAENRAVRVHLPADDRRGGVHGLGRVRLLQPGQRPVGPLRPARRPGRGRRAPLTPSAPTRQVTARLDAATKIREGQDAELWVDLRPMHVFDPESGRNLALEARADGAGG